MKKPESITKNDWFLLREKYPNDLPKIIKKISKGYPVQYIIGDIDFYDCRILVNKNVLIPRFETELLTEIAINKIKEKYKTKKIKIIDLGTGSGCIAIKLATTFPHSEVFAIDKSKKAIQLARKNAILNNVKIDFIVQKFKDKLNDKYDVVISNPPYIGLKDEVEKKVRKFEPKGALFALKKGLYYYEQILKNIKNNLTDNYLIIFEIGANQEKELIKIIERHLPNSSADFEKDYNDFNRFCIIENIVYKE